MEVVASDPDRFTMDQKVLGEGGYGKVFKGVDTKTGEKVAVKLVDTKRMKKEAIEREIRILSMFNNPNIVGLKGFWYKDSVAFIVMEMAGGGELFDRVIDAGAFNEKVARTYFSQLVNAVFHCHMQGVAHRDLKLENVLLDNSNKVKVCDFGLAHVYKRNADGSLVDQVLYETCGSKSYAAPELLRGKGYSGFAADVWSCGICLFAMLAGFFPLDEATSRDWRFGRLKQAQESGAASSTKTIYGFYGRPCPLSPDVVELLDSMISIDPKKRISMQGVLSHKWMQPAKPAGFDPNAEVMDDDAPAYRSTIPTAMSTDAMDMGFDEDEPVYRSMGPLGGGGAGVDKCAPGGQFALGGGSEVAPPLLRQNATFGLPPCPLAAMEEADPMSEMASLHAAIA